MQKIKGSANTNTHSFCLKIMASHISSFNHKDGHPLLVAFDCGQNFLYSIPVTVYVRYAVWDH